MTTILFEYILRISDDGIALHLIRTILLHERIYEIDLEQKERLEKYLDDITLYADIGTARFIDKNHGN